MPNIDTNALLANVEQARRGEAYEAMEAIAREICDEVLNDLSIDQMRVLSRLDYELHMAAYQQSLTDPANAQVLLHQSQRLAARSMGEALFAGDEVGALIAQENVYGLIYPALGKWREGVVGCEQSRERLEEIATNVSTSDVDESRAFRFAANAHCHCMRMVVAHKGSKSSVAFWLTEIAKNPVYIAKPNDFRTDVQAAQRYIQE